MERVSRARLLLFAVILASGVADGCRTPSLGGAASAPAVEAARSVDAAVDAAIIDAGNDFGFRLLDRLAVQASDANVFISPASVAIALDMSYNGARSDTAAGMALARRLTTGSTPIDSNRLNQANAALLAALIDPDPKVELAIANSLWIKPGFVPNSAFVEANRQFYGAELGQLQSAAAINDWVSRNTRDRIKGIVTDATVQDASAILVNAVYFKGAWSDPFEVQNTKEQPFTLLGGRSKTVPMMHRSGLYNFMQGAGYSAVRMPYGKGRLRMVILLPDRGTDFRAFRGKMNEAVWKEMAPKFDETPGDIALPRFRVEYGADLSTPLSDMGMKTAFTGAADFSGIAPGLRITSVAHKTFLEVNEEGTEAAAVTEITGATKSAPRAERFSMVADHPFLCAIEDAKTGAILFLGTIVEPD